MNGRGTYDWCEACNYVVFVSVGLSARRGPLIIVIRNRESRIFTSADARRGRMKL